MTRKKTTSTEGEPAPDAIAKSSSKVHVSKPREISTAADAVTLLKQLEAGMSAVVGYLVETAGNHHAHPTLLALMDRWHSVAVEAGTVIGSVVDVTAEGDPPGDEHG